MNNQILKFGSTLFTICFFAAALLSGVNFITKEKIAFQKYLKQQNALRDVAPPGAMSFEAVKKNKQVIYHLALDKDKRVLGYCFIASGYGYSSTIETMVGMDKQGKISGIKILSQAETPGLGVKIVELASETTLFEAISGKAKKDQRQKPWFQERFRNRYIDELDKVDTITGATVSSSTVIKSVEEKALEIVELVKYE